VTPRDVKRAGRALFEIARQRDEVEASVAALSALAALVEEHADLRQALVSPFVPATAKQGVIDALAPPLEMPDAVRRTLHVLADHNTLADVPAMARVLRGLANQLAGRVEATVTTAAPLSAEQVGRLENRLSEATGSQVTIDARVDTAVIGGVLARVGSVVFDGTLARQLARLKDQLVQRG
jgi:F-type H+-transporting ATPase subunit delta